MQRVFERIAKQNEAFEQLPFFAFLKDQSIDPRQRLAFAPVIAPLAMGFGELCKHVFRDEPTTDKLQALINHHTYEEHFHWQWLLEDLEKLGVDYSMRFSDALRFLWSEETRHSRSIYSTFERYMFQADPVLKLAAVEVAEVTANVFFRWTKPVALELQAMTGIEYRYFGMCHDGVENTHHIHEPEVMELFQSIELSDEMLQQTFEIVDRLFDYYTDVINEFEAFCKNHSYQEIFIESPQTKKPLAIV